ncbi:XPG family DNA repair endonuclease [uncultured virus]|nr:XPG family DNA repair endonuclease [uncultured virus]
MGIKGLPNLIKKEAGSYAIRSYKFSKFKGKGWVVSVDASLMIHQTVIAMRSTGRDMKNCEGDITSHIHGLFYKILVFLQNSIIPIFVFDGKASELKQETLDKRRKIMTDAEKKLEELSDSEDEEYIKNFKKTFRITKRDTNQIKILLDLMGIPYISAQGEADPVCAWLASRKDANGRRYCKGVCSDDSDMLVLGAPYLFRGMSRFLSTNKSVEIISLEKTLSKMGLTMDQFIDMCVMLGTDNCVNIPGIGPVGSLKLIRAHKTLQKVLGVVGRRVDEDDDKAVEAFKVRAQRMIEAQLYFKTALADIDADESFVITDSQLTLRQFQYEELMDFLCVKHGFDIERISIAINRFKEYYKMLGVVRPNTSKVHTILQPRSEDYSFKAQSDEIIRNKAKSADIACLASDSESEPETIPEPQSETSSDSEDECIVAETKPVLHSSHIRDRGLSALSPPVSKSKVKAKKPDTRVKAKSDTKKPKPTPEIRTKAKKPKSKSKHTKSRKRAKRESDSD